ncbi:MAG: DUF1738 domain-containing protein [Synergistaceae bacterium]|nr:DUF1738 domain-containing protein [Synergistaceae bacterium]
MNEYLRQQHEEITRKIIEAIEAGTAPWQRPWDGRGGPHNAGSGRAYTGINNIVLTLKGEEIDGEHDPRWLTYKQASDKGWQVKKGAKGTHVILWKPYGEEDEDGNMEIKAVWQKVYTVFHASQIEGIGEYIPPVWNEIELQEKAERIIEASGAKIIFGGNRAFFSPAGDFIKVPERGYFYTVAGYYSTMLHELVHWTGGKTRLNRRHLEYAQEELVAEMGSMFLSAATGIPQTEQNFNNDAEYIRGWLSRVSDKDKPSAIFRAAADANKAVDYLLKAVNGEGETK